MLDYRQAGAIHKSETVPRDLNLHQIAQITER